MLSRIAHHTVRRALVQRAAPRPAVAFFSSEALVPGYGKGKTSTGIVGLPVDPNAVENIVSKYQELLNKMSASDMPETAQYRMNLEKISRHRIQAAMDHPEDPDMVEELCQCGQVEELVKQADDEMLVLDMYLESRMWELVADDADEFEFDYDPNPAADQDGLEDDDEKK